MKQKNAAMMMIRRLVENLMLTMAWAARLGLHGSWLSLLLTGAFNVAAPAFLFSIHVSANLAGLAGVPDAAEVLQSVFVASFSTT
jgi:hypothetical protein